MITSDSQSERLGTVSGEIYSSSVIYTFTCVWCNEFSDIYVQYVPYYTKYGHSDTKVMDRSMIGKDSTVWK